MGRSHALSGAAVWLTGAAALHAAGAQLSASAVSIGAVVCAGWALAPDLDHPSSAIARCGGPITRGIARVTGWAGARVHAATKTRWDRPDLDGHRTLTHTAVWALLCGVVGEVAGWWYGRWAAAVLVGCAASLAFTTVLSRRLRRSGLPLLAVAGLAAAAYRAAPGSCWWLGVATGGGCLIHCLGDALTNSGCPILWPLPIKVTMRSSTLTPVASGEWPQRYQRQDRWRRWYLVGTPRAVRFDTGGPVEELVARGLAVVVVTAAGWLAWPPIHHVAHVAFAFFTGHPT